MGSKVVTIQRHVSGNPNEDSSKINWYDFIRYMDFTDEERLNYTAIALLRGEFIFNNGYTYYLLGVEEIDI